MKLTKEKRLMNIDLQRKHQMIGWELVLFLSLIILNSVIMFLFPIEREAVHANAEWDGIYYLLGLWELMIFGAMFFVAGVWITLWHKEKNRE